MLGAVLYYLLTFAESGLAVFGVRGVFEQPRYTVVQTLPGGVEIRHYAPRLAAETSTDGQEGAAFGRLFRYIAGANAAGARIAMTTPVADGAPARIAMTVPVEQNARVMRFYLPAAYVEHPPAPKDPAIHIVTLPPETVAALRYSGIPNPKRFDAHRAVLLSVLEAVHAVTEGTPYFLSYDPPFTIPFLRRNEVVVAVRVPG